MQLELDRPGAARARRRAPDPAIAVARARLMEAIRRDPAQVPATEETRRLLLGLPPTPVADQAAGFFAEMSRL